MYRNGRIIGLVGELVDVEERRSDSSFDDMPMRDSVTGTLNYTGLEAATWRYVDTSKRKGIDFAMVSVNIENFEAINADFGFKVGEKVLGHVGEELSAIAGNRHVVGHVHANRFVVLVQERTDEQLQQLCDDIEQRLMAIKQVDGTRCTVYALAGFARFSKLGDIEAMKRYNRDRRLERRDAWSGSTGESDVITSSLL